MTDSRPWLENMISIHSTTLGANQFHEIKLFSCQAHDALNSGDYSNPVFKHLDKKFQHTTPDFLGFTDLGRGVHVAAEVFNARKKFLTRNPEYEARVVDAHTYVDRESLAVADVMLVIRHVGLGGGREEDGVQMLRWMRTGRRGWRCVRSMTMRCGPGFGEVGIRV